MTLRIEAHAFALARTAGERSEDAWAVDVGAGRLAVADGASSAWRAGAWAAALVDGWIMKPPAASRGAAAVDSVLRWVDRIRDGFEQDDPDGPSAPGAERAWFTEAAAARGSHAALLGLTVQGLGGRRPRMRAVAVGDVCLMLVRRGELELSFPLEDPAAFGTHPQLISSLHGGAPAADAIIVHERALRPDDVLLVASDALAAFLLRAGQEQPRLWEVMTRIDSSAFVQLVGQGLAAGRLERDDVTLLRARIVDGGHTS